MDVTFSSRGWAQYQEWQTADRKIVGKLNRLINETARTPFTGRGKPEPLKHEFAGWWSRRITDEHRLIYRVIENRLEIAQCRYHY
ncbi:Txe/YoeB family addiction module toxin [Bosea caraganae]|uniref:Putative mRNA interferase YoeB n=1 Tax=Bosea caraganae TaxID=2763117 RepID=A0A370L515_9HYPH|nr:Txe/YoeB family addiction module toxin [Bosea caraganae]RDJ22397.1 Txe/YoeB family addiction module toxin [Bosea caraganae]RDJ23805.1 Txe/YoeB family addiction module toxin [Bosea caraganae]